MNEINIEEYLNNKNQEIELRVKELEERTGKKREEIGSEIDILMKNDVVQLLLREYYTLGFEDARELKFLSSKAQYPTLEDALKARGLK